MVSKLLFHDFPEYRRVFDRFDSARGEAYGESWGEESLRKLGWAILELFQLSREVEDSMRIRSYLATEYFRVVCPELSIPSDLHSEMLYEILENEPEDEDGLLVLPLMEDALLWPWPWFRPEDADAAPHQTDFLNRSLPERVAERVSSEISLIWCKYKFGDPEDRRDPRLEIAEGIAWLERLQKDLPPYNRIPYLLAGHMLELRDGPAGLKWLEIEERNHPGLLEVEELRNALLRPAE